MDWNKILNWKLLSGSHKFPGPDGGTCINEAAIVAAGFKYQKVENVNDCPPCFSRVIAAYAILLNDSMPDGLRQELLMPFVVRLAGTADEKNELRRAQYIAIQTIKRILPIGLRAADLKQHAQKCEAVEDLKAAADAAAAATAAATAYAAAAAYAAAYAAADAAAAAAADAANAATYAADAATYAADAAAYAAARRQIFTIAVEILDGAIRLGKQAEPIKTALVASRMSAIRARVHELS